MTPSSPFRARHKDATRLWWAGARPPVAFKHDLLRGRRAMKRPLMALLVAQDMGPCRHALAQRVVAGTMVVLDPFEDKKKAPSPRPSTSVPVG